MKAYSKYLIKLDLPMMGVVAIDRQAILRKDEV